MTAKIFVVNIKPLVTLEDYFDDIAGGKGLSIPITKHSLVKAEQHIRNLERQDEVEGALSSEREYIKANIWPIVFRLQINLLLNK